VGGKGGGEGGFKEREGLITFFLGKRGPY